MKDKDLIIEILQKVDKYHYVLDSDMDQFAEEILSALESEPDIDRLDEYDSLEKVITFLESIIIECEPNQSCGRCDDTRKIVAYLKAVNKPNIDDAEMSYNEHFEKELKKTEDLFDLMQYVTNLLYVAFNHEINPSEFDEWVEEKVGELKDYYHAQKTVNEKDATFCKDTVIKGEDKPISEQRTAEGIMPDAQQIWDNAQVLPDYEFKIWFEPYLKELEKYTEK